VNSNGKVLFAEATERFVQQKRAWGIDADHPDHIRSIFPNIIPKGSKIKVSRSWKRSKMDLPLEITGEPLLDNSSLKWMLSLQNRAFHDAGINIRQYCGLAVNLVTDSFDHHLCHAVNACYSASFKSGICLVIDGEGEVGASSVYHLKDRKLKRLWRSWGPGSLGSFYGWLTMICGFDWRKGEEWKVMGLAAFGLPRESIVEELKKVITIKAGRLFLPDHKTLVSIVNKLKPLYRKPGDDLMLAADLAASGQAAYTFFADQIIAHCEEYGENNLILSGGCALNSSYNGSIINRFSFTNIHVPSAPADDGNAIGAALLSWMKAHKTEEIPFFGGNPYLGKQAEKQNSILATLSKNNSNFKISDLNEDSAKTISSRLAEGKIIGVMRGAAEFGPRALGNRSILADPRGENTKDFINNEIKGRESYRPFAPVLFDNDVDKYFQKSHSSPYMSFTLPWKSSILKIIPAVVHADGTGRLQTVNEQSNPWMSEVLNNFQAFSGVPIILNTSFNIMGKPIVNSLEDALVVLTTSGLDAVLYDTVLIEK
jgi:carbamoyltransferase